MRRVCSEYWAGNDQRSTAGRDLPPLTDLDGFPSATVIDDNVRFHRRSLVFWDCLTAHSYCSQKTHAESSTVVQFTVSVPTGRSPRPGYDGLHLHHALHLERYSHASQRRRPHRRRPGRSDAPVEAEFLRMLCTLPEWWQLSKDEQGDSPGADAPHITTSNPRESCR